MARYAVAARRRQLRTGRPLPPWHAADLGGDDPADHVGERVASLCGVPGLQVFPLVWDGITAANGCPVCQRRAGRG